MHPRRAHRNGRPVPPPMLLGGETRRRFDRTAWRTERVAKWVAAQEEPAQSGSTIQSSRKRTRYSACGQPIFALSEKGQVQAQQFKVDLTPNARNDAGPTLLTPLQIRFSRRTSLFFSLFLPPIPPPSPPRTSSTSPSPQHETNIYIPSFLPDFASSPSLLSMATGHSLPLIFLLTRCCSSQITTPDSDVILHAPPFFFFLNPRKKKRKEGPFFPRFLP